MQEVTSVAFSRNALKNRWIFVVYLPALKTHYKRKKNLPTMAGVQYITTNDKRYDLFVVYWKTFSSISAELLLLHAISNSVKQKSTTFASVNSDTVFCKKIICAGKIANKNLMYSIRTSRISINFTFKTTDFWLKVYG